MSNYAVLVATEFKNIHDGYVSYGYRVYDDYGCAYNNFCEDTIVTMSDTDLLKLALEHSRQDDDATYILNYAIHEGGGLEINGTHYDSDELMEMLK